MSGLLAAFAVTGGLAWLAAGRRRGPLGIAGSLLTVQGVLHLVFSAAQPGAHAPAAAATGPAAGPATGPAHHHLPTAPPASAPGHGPGHSHSDHAADLAADLATTADPAGALSALPGLADASGPPGLADLAAMAGHGGVGMVAAHALAGLFCALWLAWGEAAVFRLLHTLRAVASAAALPLLRAAAAALGARVPVPPARPAPFPAYRRPRRLRGAVHAHAVVRRGPPGWPITRATAPGRPARA
ncbi:hypothetical protein [Streptomyces sp. NPDC012888]|uniref:hypothetical protein n=1 Tax=Streptomyces sp. NPDC012888 TaxID=3364855 RepID=UPI003689EEA1